MRSLRYLNGGTLSPFPAEAGQDELRTEFESKGVPVKEGSWGYLLLVVDDFDGNQLFFNYPNETASSQTVRDEAEAR